MKKMLLAITVLLLTSGSFAQTKDAYTDDEKGGPAEPRVFMGGSLALGFTSYSFGVGGNPEIGYSIADWLDAGLVFNVNYSSQRDPNGYDNTKYRSFNYGAGVFTRIYPVNFLFVQLQPEQNWIKYTTVYTDNTKASATTQAASFIAGIGYGQRVVGQGSYFLMVGIDLLNNINSPYRDSYSGAAVPIVRAGFDFYLKPSKKKSRD